MTELFKDLTLNHGLLVILLVILSLWLKRFMPPIKEQYQCIVLLVVGGLLGMYLIKNALIGISISGLVFYKEILVNELLLIKDSFNDLKGDNKDNNNKDNKENDK